MLLKEISFLEPLKQVAAIQMPWILSIRKNLLPEGRGGGEEPSRGRGLRGTFPLRKSISPRDEKN